MLARTNRWSMMNLAGTSLASAGAALRHRDDGVEHLDHASTDSSTKAVPNDGPSIGSTMLQRRRARRGMPSMRAAFHRLSSMPRRPASISAITRPRGLPHGGDDDRVDHHVLVDDPVEREVGEAPAAHGRPAMPSSGLSIHCQTRPVATKDIAYGYRKTVRSTPSPRTRWSMKTASRKPITRQADDEQHAERAPCSAARAVQRSLSNRRAYCVRPTKSPDGKRARAADRDAHRPQHAADVGHTARSPPSAAAPRQATAWRRSGRRARHLERQPFFSAAAMRLLRRRRPTGWCSRTW